MTTFRTTSNAAEVAADFLKARAAIDPAFQADMGPLGKEALEVERGFTPKGKKVHERGKTLSESIYLKVGRLGFQTRTNKRYANIINSGGRTGPHEIVPRKKQALAFGGFVLKRVNHPGGHYRAEHFAEKTIAVIEPRWIEETTKTVNRAIEEALS